MNPTGSNGATNLNFDYTKIVKMVVDLKDLKQDAEGQFIRDSFTRFCFIDEQWEKIPDSCFYDSEFKKYMEQNFSDTPYLIEDDGKTLFFNKKVEPNSKNLYNNIAEGEDGIGKAPADFN